jgi:hypothetical protein
MENGREKKQAVFSEGEAIINPVGLFTAPRWNAATERLMVAFSPETLNRVSEELDSNGVVELEPQYPCRDELLTQLVRSLMTEFEQESHPDLVYAESLTHTLMAHLIKKYSRDRIRSGWHDTPFQSAVSPVSSTSSTHILTADSR